MNLSDIIKAVKALIPSSWKGTVDGKPVTVTHVDCGENGPTFWLSINYTADGVAHKIMAKTPVMVAGQRGGNDHVTLDGQNVGIAPADKEDLVFGPQTNFFHFPPQELLVAAAKWESPVGTPHRVEIKGAINIPGL